MDLSLLANLKDLLTTTKRFISVWEYFLDHFGEDAEFLALGERTRHPFLEGLIPQLASQVFKREVDAGQFLLTRLPEHQFLHGGGPIGGGLANVLYFEDIQVGMMALLSPALGPTTQFIRFSGRQLPPLANPSVN